MNICAKSDKHLYCLVKLVKLFFGIIFYILFSLQRIGE